MRELTEAEIAAVDGGWSMSDITGTSLGVVAGLATGLILTLVAGPIAGVLIGVTAGAGVSLGWAAATEQPKVDVPKPSSGSVRTSEPIPCEWTCMEGMGGGSSGGPRREDQWIVQY